MRRSGPWLVAILTLTGCAAGSSGGKGNGLGGLGGNPVCASELEPQEAMRLDAGCISAREGGTIALTGDLSGAVLEVPPGALDEDTTIGVRHPRSSTEGIHRLIFEPAGLQFSEPVRITGLPIPWPDAYERPILTVLHGSADNPVVDVGGQQHQFVPADAIDVDIASRTLSGELAHFSEWWVLFGVQRPAYLVLQFHEKYLRPGDGLFVLTGDPGEQNWIPGHVGVVNSVDPIQDQATVIESTTGGGEGGNVDGVQINSFTLFKTGSNHVYMGARRMPGPILHDSQRQTAIEYGRFYLGKPYSLFGSSRVSNGFSCSGLVKQMWEAADGEGVVGALDFFITPVELYERTVPIEHLEIEPFEEFAMPVVPVGIHPDSDPNNAWFGGYYASGIAFGDVAIYVDGLPDGATFERDFGTVERHWTFRWTPDIDDIGQTHTVTFRMSGTRIDEEGWGWDYDVAETLELEVRGNVFNWDVSPVRQGETALQYFGWADIPAGYTPRAGELIDDATGEIPVNPIFPNQIYQNTWQDYQDTTYRKWGCGFRLVRIDNPWDPGPSGLEHWSCWYDLVPTERYTGL